MGDNYALVWIDKYLGRSSGFYTIFMRPCANLDCYMGQKYLAYRRAEKKLTVSKGVLKNKLGVSKCPME